jgi:hypothetical protein
LVLINPAGCIRVSSAVMGIETKNVWDQLFRNGARLLVKDGVAHESD